ncbi:hypothetical protein ElyMa_004699700 [Elysia marginata]|uniref:Uncharacterized protein n=1 Tax=Elysia marginata TaxID=1093978 RepID=A0AAV4I7V2_9GAST|nr:hypothetical protein ElyMa_004699700 [Elysia marginata]
MNNNNNNNNKKNKNQKRLTNTATCGGHSMVSGTLSNIRGGSGSSGGGGGPASGEVGVMQQSCSALRPGGSAALHCLTVGHRHLVRNSAQGSLVKSLSPAASGVDSGKNEIF